MASIIKRKRSDGAFAYRADIRIKRDGVIVHQESQTFDRQALEPTLGALNQKSNFKNLMYSASKNRFQ